MTPANPLPAELSAQLAALSPTQLAWLSGYCWAQSQGAAGGLSVSAAPAVAAPARRVLVLSASQTGNARGVAESLHAKLKNAGVEAVLSSAGDFKSKTLPDEDIMLLVTSTQGEGEPPEEALPLYKFVFGKKAPDLGKLTFAVLGLGDSSYPNFCQAGKDFDAKFAELGARRLNDLGICDLEFQSAADAWIEAVVPQVAELAVQTAAASVATPAAPSKPQALSIPKTNPIPPPCPSAKKSRPALPRKTWSTSKSTCPVPGCTIRQATHWAYSRSTLPLWFKKSSICTN